MSNMNFIALETVDKGPIVFFIDQIAYIAPHPTRPQTSIIMMKFGKYEEVKEGVKSIMEKMQMAITEAEDQWSLSNITSLFAGE